MNCSKKLTSQLISRRKLESMVLAGRPSIYHRLVVHGPVDDSGAGLPILGTCTTEVCTFHDLGVYGFFLDNCVSVVFLGLFAGLQLLCYQRIYWGLETLRPDEYAGGPFAWITTHS